VSVNIEGRYQYLSALERHWYKPLANLFRDVFPFYVPPQVETIDTWDRADSESLRDFRERMTDWADSVSFRDTWLMDAAMQTMEFFSRLPRPVSTLDSPRRFWWYLGDGTTFLIFSPDLDKEIWLPPEHGGESWDEFAEKVTRKFTGQLSEYRSKVVRRYGLEKTDMPRDAAWTVLYQSRQKSIAELAADLSGPYKDKPQTVKKAIQRFSRGIGLTLSHHGR
jgi:hypothetical protein